MCQHKPRSKPASTAGREPSVPILRRVPPNTESIVVGDPTMTNYRVENGRRDFLLAIAGGIADWWPHLGRGRFLRKRPADPLSA